MRKENLAYWQYLRVKAIALELEGKPLESENVLQTLLTCPDDKLGICYTMWDLANLHKKSGRYEEAIPLYEKSFYTLVEIYGIEDKSTKYLCWALGFSYAQQGRLNKAITHFQ
jgi:tetratricopeptide (TPR) repeat protein